MKTLNDIKDLCQARGLSINCILNNLANKKHGAWFASLSEQSKIDFIFDYIEQWSRNDSRIEYLAVAFDIPCAWPERESHAIGKQVASAIMGESIFGAAL